MTEDLYTIKSLKFIKKHKINMKQAAKLLGISYMSLHQTVWHHRKISRPKYIALIYAYKLHIENIIDKLNAEPKLDETQIKTSFVIKKNFKKFVKRYNLEIKFVSDLLGYSYSSLRSNHTKLKSYLMNKSIICLIEYFTKQLNSINIEIKKIDV